MKRALGWTLAVIVVLAAAAFGARAYATRAMYARAVTPKALGAATPATDSLPFAKLAIPSGDRTLVGWWVRAPADSGAVAPALLFLHGNRSAISDYVPLQRFLYRQGVSSLVFDYAGFGASGGDPSLRHAIEDAGTVARVFAESAGTGRRTAMGSALGATVLLQAIDSVQPRVHGVVIEGVTASVREAAVRDGRIPRLLAPLVPDIADNSTAAGRVRVPFLAVHSVADNRFPIADAERVVARVPGPSALVRHPRKGHSALLTSSRPCDWSRVLAFVRDGTLPPDKEDSSDICATEARLKAVNDSIAAVRSALARDSAARAAARAESTRAAAAKTKSMPATKTKAPATKTPATKTTKSTAPTRTKVPSTKTKTSPAPARRPTTTKRP